MSSKLIERKLMKRTIQRTPLRISRVLTTQPLPSTSTSRPSNSRLSMSSILSSDNIKPIFVEEYNKLLFKNAKLAKDNALIKYQFNKCNNSLQMAKRDNLELKQQLNCTERELEKLRIETKNKELANINQISDRVKYVVSLLMDDYFGIDAMKEQINEFGNKVETIKGIFNSLHSMIESKNESNESQSGAKSELLNAFWATNGSISRRDSHRWSLSSQDRDIQRRLSSERIKRDFNVLTDLSTILELSREQRISSIECVNDSASGVNTDANAVVTEIVDTMSASTSANSTNTIRATIRKSISKSTISTSTSEVIVKNTKKPKKRMDNINTNKKKKNNKIENKTKNAVNPKTSNDSVLSIYDFEEEKENKENVIPIRRQSKRIQSKQMH